MIINDIAAVVLVAVMGTGTTLNDSQVSFKQALGACGGALGSVSFSLGHARIAAAAGVDTDETVADASGMLTAVLTSASGTQSAKVSIDQKKRVVSAKHLRVEMGAKVACILPD